LTVESSVGGVRCNKLVDTESAVTLAYEKIMRDSKTLWDVLKHVIQLKTASRDELEVMNECVTEIIFVGLVTLLHTVLWAVFLSTNVNAFYSVMSRFPSKNPVSSFSWHHCCQKDSIQPFEMRNKAAQRGGARKEETRGLHQRGLGESGLEHASHGRKLSCGPFRIS
ncbi:hypothetical protein T10_9615, partial [Trichinella papuae]